MGGSVEIVMKILLTLLLVTLSTFGATTFTPGPRNVTVDTNGVLLAPTNFFAANSSAVNAVITGGGGGSGTVTSIAMTVPAFLTLSGSPITTSGTLAVSYSGTALPIANGGTGGTSASGARTSLGLQIGLNVPAWSANLDAWSLLATSSKQDYSVNLDAWALLATSEKQDASANLDDWSAITTTSKLTAANNLSDIVSALTARANLGVTIGQHVEAWSANLDAWSALATSAKQNASANLTSWSAIAPGTKQDQSANLDSWSAVAPSSKQDASANLNGWSAIAPSTKQDADSDLTAWALLTPPANAAGFMRNNGSGTFSYAEMSGDATTSGSGVLTLATVASAGTYRSVTVNAKGLVTAGTAPTTFSGYALSDTSANLATALTDETGTGAAVFATSPTFSTSATFSYATANTVGYFNGSKDLVSSAVTPTELGYLSGVTSSLQTQIGTLALQATTISAGAGMSGGGSLAANRTLTWDPSTFVGNVTLWDGANASRTITYNLSGTDPVWTIGSSSVDLTTGTLKQGGNAVLTSASTLASLASSTSANLATTLSDESGSGVVVFGTKPIIDVGVSMGSDDTYSGITRSGLNNSGGVTQWDAVYLNSSSQWVLADANGSGTYPCRGLATATVSTAGATTVVVRGTVRNDAWSWTPGGTIYLSTTAGGLTQTAPSATGDKIQVIGYALDADTMAVEISSDYGTAP